MKSNKFWMDALNGVADRDAEQPLIPILVEIKDWQRELTMTEKAEAIAGVQALAAEVFDGDGSPMALPVRDDMLAVLLVGSEAKLTDLARRCGDFSSDCESRLKVTICCCIGEQTTAAELKKMFEAMVTVSRENITGEKLLLLRFGVASNPGLAVQPDFAGWKELLLCGQYDRMLMSLTEFFFTSMAANRLTFESLRRFRHDLMQIMYVVLSEKGIEAHVVFDCEKGNTMWMTASDSVSEFMTWAFWSVAEMADCLERTETRAEKLKRLTDYIDRNPGAELSRGELARRANMSDSALARLFHRETGMTITEYVFARRLEAAKMLLRQTELPLGEIAEKCGFHSYPYFFTRFRETVGTSPSAYRSGSF